MLYVHLNVLVTATCKEGLRFSHTNCTVYTEETQGDVTVFID